MGPALVQGFGMQARVRLLRGATALLYFGPLLAGIGGAGWRVVPLFAAIFLLWLFILRPQQWPRKLADWARPEALIALLTQGVVQVLLVAVSFGIGRGIGGVMGLEPALPLMLPVAISFLSIPLARMIWDPWAAEPGAASLDEVMARVEAEEAGAEAADLQGQIAKATRMVAELDRLPPDAPPETLAAHLAAMATQTSPEALRVALMDPIYDGSASALHRRAAVVHATEPAVADALRGSTYPMAVLHAVSDAPTVGLFATRCAALVRARPERQADCPDPEDVAVLAGRLPEVAAELRALAEVLREARAGAGPGGTIPGGWVGPVADRAETP